MFTLIIEDKHGGIADEYSFEEGEFYIGRSHNSDIILPSDNVSRRHARLYTADGRCYIEDLNSSNGVFVNGRRIHEVYQIQRSAQVKIGDYYLHIESDTDAVVEEDRTFCRLTGRNLAFANQVFRVQRKVTLIGRGKDCSVTVIDPSVSRIHAKLTVERSGSLTIEDLKSSNGTFVNDDRIDIATLNHGDIVRFGNVEFVIETAEGSAERPAARPASAPARVSSPSVPAVAARSMDRPVERAAGDRRYSTVGVAPAAYEDEWATMADPPQPTRRRSLWLVLSIIGGVLVLAGILLAIFHKDIFGPSEPARPQEVVEASPSPDEIAAQEASERERERKEIDALFDMGNERVKNRQWDLALERFNEVLDRNPVHPDIHRVINQVNRWKQDKERLDEARKLRIDLKRGEAATLLREIDESSVYYEEAQGELQQLLASKSTMAMNVENKLRQRDCEGALEDLRELQLVDPRDASVAAQIEDVEKRLGTRRCK